MFQINRLAKRPLLFASLGASSGGSAGPCGAGSGEKDVFDVIVVKVYKNNRNCDEATTAAKVNDSGPREKLLEPQIKLWEESTEVTDVLIEVVQKTKYIITLKQQLPKIDRMLQKTQRCSNLASGAFLEAEHHTL